MNCHISRTLAQYKHSCQHYTLTCSLGLEARYLKCMQRGQCAEYKERTDWSELASLLLIRHQDDYVVFKLIWQSLNDRELRGSCVCKQHVDCVVSWDVVNGRVIVSCPMGIRRNMGLWHLLESLIDYESWKQKLGIYK